MGIDIMRLFKKQVDPVQIYNFVGPLGLIEEINGTNILTQEKLKILTNLDPNNQTGYEVRPLDDGTFELRSQKNRGFERRIN